MTPNRSKSTRARAGRTPVRPVRRPQPSRTSWIIGGLVVLALLGLFVIYRAGSGVAGAGSGSAAGSDRFQVGSPGVGAPAPEFLLPDVAAPPAAGDLPVQLADYRGKTVLLYFHESLGCQPCWDQIRDLQKDPATLASVGTDQLLTITTGPLDPPCAGPRPTSSTVSAASSVP